MRILVFHGYPLRGTGSNVYNAELARAMAATGHEVHLFCQDDAPDELPFVDAVGGWEAGALAVRALDRERPTQWGSCTVYRPAIGDILPVYVADRYDRFDGRRFDTLSDAELDHYLAVNVAAVGEVAGLVKPDCALANHLIMGPSIVARALAGSVPFAVKVHGSALEYIVRPYPRFLSYAEEGMAACATALVGSLHTARRLWDTVAVEGLPERTFLGPPGVDIEAFRPRSPAQQRADVAALGAALELRSRAGFDAAAASAVDRLYRDWRRAAGFGADALGAAAGEIRSGYDPSGIDADAPAAAWAVAEFDGPLMLFVGKLIASKGVELAIAALPLLAQRVPDVRFAIAGFGEYREGLELLVRCLTAGDLDGARQIAAYGRALEGGEVEPLPQLAAFFESLDGAAAADYCDAAQNLAKRIHWFGRIEHDLLAKLAPRADVQVVPSTFPEAFGMVVAEAAACGVMPISAHHSGLAEVSDRLAAALDPAVGDLLAYDNGPAAVREIAQKLGDVLLLDRADRNDVGARLAAVAQAEFSWDGVAKGVLTAACGRRDNLRRPV